MKRIVFLTIALLTFFNASAQDFNPQLSIGAKGGVSLSQTMFSPNIDQSFIIGQCGGIMVRYIEENHFGLIGEINWVNRGWKETFKDTSYEFSRKLNYLQIPLLAHIYFGSDRAKVFLNAGPEIGFLISNSSTMNFNPNDVESLEDFPEFHETAQMTMDIKNKIDYGISAGLGVEISINSKHSLLMEGRFYYGLNNVFGANKKDVFSASNGIAIMATLGYYFRLK